MNRVILASQSPRRRELLQRIIPEFEIIPAQGEERSDAADPETYVCELAMHKAREVMRHVITEQNLTVRKCTAVDEHDLAAGESEQAVSQIEAGDDESDIWYIIGADTIVVCDGEIMGKPCDHADAYRMIHTLQGRSHEVMTGVCVLRVVVGAPGCDDAPVGAQDGANAWDITTDAFTSITKVHVAPMTDAEIRHYLATGEADDKAGAYGIQGAFGLYVTGIEGSYSNVVGLPVAALYQSLKSMGLQML